MDDKAVKILNILEEEYPDASLALRFSNPLELLIATILSAQCTDERVNKVTPILFERYKKAEDYAQADVDELESIIKPTGFYKNKARMIIGCCKRIVEAYQGRVPDRLEDLITLPGVGRKTANIVLGNAYGRQAIAVDTHVKRVSQRLGLASSSNPDRIEEELCSRIPEDRWTRATNLLILHGRNTCVARRPFCSRCRVRDYCDYWSEGGEGR